MSEHIPGQPGGGSMIVCDDCGRVNIVRRQLVGGAHCSGCGCLLPGMEAPRILHTKCPGCAEIVEADEAMAGKEVVCKKCGIGVVVEALPKGRLPDRRNSEKTREEAASVSKATVVDEVDYHAKSRRKRRFRRRPRRSGEKISSKSILVVVLCFVLGGLAAGIIIVEEGYWAKWTGDVEEEESAEQPVELPAAFRRGAEVEEIVLSPGQHVAIGAALQGFLSAGEPAGRLRWSRFAAVVEPRLKEYYQRNLVSPVGVEGYDVRYAMRHEGRLFVRVQVALGDGRLAVCVLEETPDGEFLVDWDAYVRYGSMEWPAFVTQMPQQSQRFSLRVKRTFEWHRNYPVEAFSSFLFFRNDPHDGVPVFVVRGSKEEEVLLGVTAIESGTPSVEPEPVKLGFGTATVVLSFNPEDRVEGSPMCVRLEELLHGGWVDLRPGFSHVAGGLARDGAASATDR